MGEPNSRRWQTGLAQTRSPAAKVVLDKDHGVGCGTGRMIVPGQMPFSAHKLKYDKIFPSIAEKNGISPLLQPCLVRLAKASEDCGLKWFSFSME